MNIESVIYNDYELIAQYLYKNEPFCINWTIGKEIMKYNFMKLLDNNNNDILNRDVSICNEINNKTYDNKRVNIPLNEFIDKVRVNELLYLKDWHIEKEYDYKFIYPIVLHDDWIDWHCKNYHKSKDDYSFMYIGVENTSTGIHHDVCCSYSWSINLHGIKKWILYPIKYYNKDILDSDIDSFYDESNHIQINKSKSITYIQQEGEIIIIPSGWYHQVENISSESNDTISYLNNCIISVNRNWFNSFNIFEIFKYIMIDLLSVRKEIWHLRDHSNDSKSNNSILMTDREWYNHCDILLLSNTSINIKLFIEILTARVYYMHTLVQHVKSISTNMNSNWTDLFCPEVDSNMISERDIQLYNYYIDTFITNNTTDNASSYLTNCIEISNDVNDTLVDIFKLFKRASNPFITNRISIWSYTIAEIKYIFTCLLESNEMLIVCGYIYNKTADEISDYFIEITELLKQLDKHFK